MKELKMKTQTVHGVEFVFANFNHAFGRNVLSEFICQRFFLSSKSSDIKAAFTEFKELHPNACRIFLQKMPDVLFPWEINPTQALIITHILPKKDK